MLNIHSTIEYWHILQQDTHSKTLKAEQYRIGHMVVKQVVLEFLSLIFTLIFTERYLVATCRPNNYCSKCAPS